MTLARRECILPPMSEVPESPPRPELVSFELRNFRAFSHARVELEPDITVLIGRNDVGKSTLLEAISRYGSTLGEGSQGSDKTLWGIGPHAPFFAARWRLGSEIWEHSIRFDARDPEERLSTGEMWWRWDALAHTLDSHAGEFKVNGLKSIIHLTTLSAKQWLLNTNVPEAVFAPLGTAASFAVAGPYLFEPSQLRKYNAFNATRPPELTGRGWPIWLQQVLNRRDGDFEAIETALRGMFPFFRGLRLQIRQPSAAENSADAGPDAGLLRYNVSIEVGSEAGESDESPPRVLPVDAASSGLLLALAHLALAYADDDSRLFLLEEPENGLNAKITLDMMRSFLDAVRQRKRQIILTTHNPWWLDLVPRESIRVLTRDKVGAHVHRPNVDELDALLAEIDAHPSELMDVYGPEGLLMNRRPRQ